MKSALILLLSVTTVSAALPPDHAERMAKGLVLFKEAGALLKEHCLNCHGGDKTKADFDLATREGLLAGGKDGVAVVPFDAAGSKLLKMLRHEEEPHMPDKKPKLSDEMIAKIAAWIDYGAPYETPLVAGKAAPRDKSKVTDEDRKWWAFQPLSPVEIPTWTEADGATYEHANPIDSFLEAAGRKRNLSLNHPVDLRMGIRRAYLTVTGLPPSPAELDAAIREATKPTGTALDGIALDGIDYPTSPGWTAFVTSLLASPHYGERWARHWLDAARFAESSGFEHDYDRPNAWYYRDFVIRAFNADMPWDQFVQWQIAGDEYAPGNAEAMMATGFLGAGVFPTQITANEVERVRYDAMDDMLSTTGSAMLGLTIGCARCHDHKFDPFPTQDYYRLLSTFTTTVRSNVDLEVDPSRNAAAKAQHKAEHDKLIAEREGWEKATLTPGFEKWLASKPSGLPSSGWALADGSVVSKGGASFRKMPDGSWLAEGANAASDVYTFTTSLPSPGAALTALKLEALADASMPSKGPGRANNGNFALSRIRVSAEAAGGAVKDIALKPGEFTHQQNSGGLSVASSLDDNAQSGWAVDGQIGKDHAAVFVFAEPVQLPAKLTVTLEFAVNTSHNIGRPRFSFASGALPKLNESPAPAAIAALAPKLASPSSLNSTERQTLWTWWKERQPEWQERERKIAEHAGKVPKAGEPVLICAEGYDPLVMHSQGPPFLQETHILSRGDTNKKVAPATQSFLQVLMRGADEKRWQWSPPAGAKSSGRRRSLANWMTDVDHGAGALMARVAVNRLWQHHFGRGLVATPNDFGKTGTLPSEPELLDWLAGELVRNGWKLKPIHRLIMTSQAWRQSTIADAAKLAADPDNALFLRAMPRRLEAEAARDTILAVSGQLDPTLFGKGTLDENSRRRSIYFTVKRSQLVNSMVVFDAPEPLTSQGNRPVTTVAPQALFLMNSPQARAWAAALAAKVWPAASTEARVRDATLHALSRSPNADELATVLPFLEKQTALHREAGHADPERQSLTDYCQSLFGLNEFLYVP